MVILNLWAGKDMSKFKHLLLIIMSAFNILEAFAYKSGRGRLDSEPSDFLSGIMAVFGIIIGGAFCFFVFYNILKNGVKEEDKEMNKWGCLAFLAVIACFLLLASMCSD